MRLSALAMIALAAATTLAGAQQLYPYQDSKVPAEDRITDLLSRMTIDEKIGALSTNPSVPRLGIIGSTHVEGLHGLALGGPGGWEGRGMPVIPTTQFPQSRGLGQTWDPELLRQAAAQEAYESRFAFTKYRRGGLVVRAPNADLSRDPRWGRSEESYGEDPFLVGTLAIAFGRGLQGDGKYWETASLLKHFMANSNEDGRDGSSSDFDTRLMREYYSVPFRMSIEAGTANAIMTSYNAWNHVPMTANPVVREMAMQEWGLNGIICTDAGALTNMVKEHHAYSTLAEAAAAAIHSGINQFLDDYKTPVQEALDKKLITVDEIDRNLRGVYRVMLKLGLLDDNNAVPYSAIGYEKNMADPWNAAETHTLVRRVTDESIVLLKNQGKLLPLDAEKIHSIAVIGPLADDVALDWYSGTPPYTISPLAGIRNRVPGARVFFSNGKDLTAAAALAAKAEVAVVVIGNHPTCNAGWAKCPLDSDGKEAIDRKSMTLKQEEIAQAILAANPRTIVVLQTSFPFTTTWTEEHVPAILEMTHNSQEQGTALADVLFGDYNPAGRLTQTWVRSMSDLPPMMDYDLRHGRTYMYAKTAPLYAFGYGLSYTEFRYSDLKLGVKEASEGDTVPVSFTLRNTGGRDGDEVAQLYVSWENSKVARPQKMLVGFTRVHLKAGESRKITVPIQMRTLMYWDEQAKKFKLEAGPVRVQVGGSSDRIQLHTSMEVAAGRK